MLWGGAGGLWNTRMPQRSRCATTSRATGRSRVVIAGHALLRPGALSFAKRHLHREQQVAV